MNQAMQNGATKARAWMEHMTGCTVAAKAQVKQCLINKGSLSELTSELNKSTFSTKINTVALQTLSTVGNTLLFLGIAKGIELAAKGIDNFVHSTEHCKERANELISSYQSAIDTANNNATTAEELSNRYETLSQSVNNLGENVSLTTEEYSEYNNIVNQIADMFPTLVQGYTEEGNAILSLKGNVEQLRGAYKEAQQEAYNMLIASGKDSDGNDIIKNWNNLDKTSFDFGSIDVGKGISYNDAIKTLNAVKDMSYEDYWDARVATTNTLYDKLSKDQKLVRDHMTFLDDNLDADIQDEDAYTQYQQEAKVLVQTYNAEVESRLSGVETLANAYLMTNEDYAKLDEESKNAASIIVNSLNADIASDFHSKEDVGTYVDKIVKIMSTNPDVQKALVGLFTMDTTDMPIDNVQSAVNYYTKNIAEYLEEDPVKLKTRLGFDNSETQSLIKQVQGFLDSEDNVKIEELTLGELQTAAEKIEVPEGTLLSWEQLKQKIEEATDTANDTVPPTPLSFSKAWKQLEDSTGVFKDDETIRNTHDSLQDLARSGQLTAETLQETDGADTFLAQIGIGAEEAAEKILNLLSTQEKLAAFSQGLSGLSSAFEEFQKNKFLSAETLNSLPDAFKNLKSYDVFSQIAGDPNSGTQKIQNAFDQIVTEYLESQKILDNATSQNKNEIIANLQQAGIGNAKDLVNSYVNSMEENKPLIQGASDEILQYLSNNNQADVNNFIAALQAKNANYTELASALGENNASLMAKFGNQYGNDLANWISLLQQKQEAYNQFVQEYNNSLEEQQNHFDSLKMPVERAVATGTADTTTLTQNADKVSKAKQNMDNAETDLKKTKQKTTKKLAKMHGKINVSGYQPKSTAGSNGNSNTTPKETKQSFDWLERRISVLTNKLDLLKAKLENVFSVQGKNSLINEEIKKTNALFNLYKKQAKTYLAQANKSARSNKDANGNDKAKLTGKKGNALKKQIQTGQLKGSKKQWIQEYDGKTANAIEEYQNYWDKYQTARKNRQDAVKNKRELQIQKRQNWVDYYDSIGSQYDAQIDTAATAREKNKLEQEKLAYIKKSYNQQIKIAKLEDNSVKAATLLAQKWKEISDSRERILQNQLDENADIRDYNNAAYENADNSGKKGLSLRNIDSYNNDNQAHTNSVQSAQDTLNTANNDVAKTAKAVSKRLKKESIDPKIVKEINGYLNSGKKVPDKHLKMAENLSSKLYEKLVAYNNAIDIAGTASDALAKAQENQQKALEENATAIREEKSKSIQLDIDAANNTKDRLSAEYSNLTTADAKNKNIDSQWLQQFEIHNKTVEKLNNDITDAAELAEALAKEEAEWLSSWREMTILQLQNLSDEQSAQYDLNQQLETNADTARDKNKYEAESRKNLKQQYAYEMQIAAENGDLVEQERLRLELEEKIEDSYEKQIANIREEYDLIIGMNDARKSTIESQISALQANGYGIGTELYQIQMSLDQDSYEKSLEEIARISAELPNLSGDARKQAEIDLETEKQKAWNLQKAIAESQQAINDINLGKIERLGTMLGYAGENLEYIQDILSHSNFTLSDKDIGGLTTEGLASMAVTFAQIANNTKQISNLYDQIAEKQRQLESNKNTELGDQLTEEITSLTQQAHDLEKGNYDFGQSIKDMVIDSLNSLADALDENISKYKDALQAQKDLYDYRKKVADQLKSIASLEKQLAALQGSNTEEARARIQKLQIELEDERQNLKDTEYDKYIQDQEEMLDKVSDDFQDFIANVAKMNVSEICAAMKTVISNNLPAIGSAIEGAFAESSQIGELASSIDGLSEMIEKLNFSGNTTANVDDNGNIHYEYQDNDGNIFGYTVDNNNSPGTVTDVTMNGETLTLPGKEVTNTANRIDEATLKRGKGVLTPAQIEQIRKLAEKLLPLNTVVSSMASLPNNLAPIHHSPAATNTTVRNVDIHLDGSHVMDADSFIQTLHNPKVLREVSNGVSSQLNSVMSNRLGNF